MIECRNIYKSYNKKNIIEDFSHHFPKNKITAIIGPSGCGKTTLLRLIMKLEEADSGEIIINDNNPYKISSVFQENRLLAWYTALENINIIVNDIEKSKEILNKVGLSDDCDKYPDEMSGGMNQRVSIARALAYESEILLLDEPFKTLDSELKTNIAKLIKSERDKRTIVIVSHDLDIIGQISDEVISLKLI